MQHPLRGITGYLFYTAWSGLETGLFTAYKWLTAALLWRFYDSYCGKMMYTIIINIIISTKEKTRDQNLNLIKDKKWWTDISKHLPDCSLNSNHWHSNFLKSVNHERKSCQLPLLISWFWLYVLKNIYCLVKKNAVALQDKGYVHTASLTNAQTWWTCEQYEFQTQRSQRHGRGWCKVITEQFHFCSSSGKFPRLSLLHRGRTFSLCQQH